MFFENNHTVVMYRRTNSMQQRNWLSQLEMRTYSGPARRIWLGPQFTFMTYAEPEELVAPSQVSFNSENGNAM